MPMPSTPSHPRSFATWARKAWRGAWVGMALGTTLWAQGPAPAKGAYASVDPFIGTGGEGHTFPGAVVPFGMVQLSPDTQIRPRKSAYGWAAGYRYDDTSMVGFSHTHFSGTGHSDLGDVLLMPTTGRSGWSEVTRPSPAVATLPGSPTPGRWPSPATTP